MLVVHKKGKRDMSFVVQLILFMSLKPCSPEVWNELLSRWEVILFPASPCFPGNDAPSVPFQLETVHLYQTEGCVWTSLVGLGCPEMFVGGTSQGCTAL